MKWRNKGHEFDNIGEILKKIDNIYIYMGLGNMVSSSEDYFKVLERHIHI